MRYEFPFEFGSRVHIDGETTISAAVAEYAARRDLVQVRLQWWTNGSLQEGWFDLPRVVAA